MRFVYLFSSQNGEVSINEEMLSRPFLVRPFESHPFMTLKDYFDAVRDSVLTGEGDNIYETGYHDIEEIRICYEKYGTLYHIARVDIVTRKEKESFAVSTAVLPHAKEAMIREFHVLERLNKKKEPSYLPEVYRIGKVRVVKDGVRDTPMMMLSRWFEGYEEWHFKTEDDGRESVVVWDMKRGDRRLSGYEAYGLIKKATYILTYYYDVAGCLHITPWHNSAGDFIVRLDHGEVDVKLVTARDFRPVFFVPGEKGIDPLRGLFLFLIETTVKMRLDREGGVGERIIVGTSIIEAVLDGFLKGMEEKEARGEMGGITLKDVVSKLKAIKGPEIKTLLNDFLSIYRMDDPAEAMFFEPYLEGHIDALMAVFKTL